MNGGQWALVLIICTLVICVTVDNIVANVLRTRRGEDPSTVIHQADDEAERSA